MRTEVGPASNPLTALVLVCVLFFGGACCVLTPHTPERHTLAYASHSVAAIRDHDKHDPAPPSPSRMTSGVAMVGWYVHMMVDRPLGGSTSSARVAPPYITSIRDRANSVNQTIVTSVIHSEAAHMASTHNQIAPHSAALAASIMTPDGECPNGPFGDEPPTSAPSTGRTTPPSCISSKSRHTNESAEWAATRLRARPKDSFNDWARNRTQLRQKHQVPQIGRLREIC